MSTPKNKNNIQAVLFGQGKKALEGDVSGHSDVEVRKKGRNRVARRVGGGALALVGVTAALSHGTAKQDQVNANQVRADKAEAGKIFSNPGPGLSVTEGAPTASVPVAPESTVSTSPESEPVVSTGEATTPAAAPTEGAWTPTPGAEPVSTPTESAQGGQTPETGGLPAEPAPPETGGVSPK